jgi:ankyrin repeat protein
MEQAPPVPTAGILEFIADGNTTDAVSLIRKLKQDGKDLDNPASTGASPLTWAVSFGQAEVVDALIRAGASLELPDKQTMLIHLAAQWGHVRVVHCLAKWGADPNALDQHGNTPAFIAAAYGQPQAIDALVQHGADLNQQDTHGLAPIHAAAKWGQAEALSCLIGHGVSPDAPNRYADTPAFFATVFGRPNVIEALVRHGADLNLANEEGWAPVHAATTPGNEATLKILLDWGVDAGAIGVRRITAAHAAAISGNAAAIDLLREAGAMLNMENAAGKTPLQVARAQGKPAVVAALEKMPPDGPRMEAAVQALVTSSDTETSNLGVDLRCPVLYTAYNQTGGSRPVRLPSGTVLSAIAARSCLTRTDGLAGDPMNGSQFDRATVQAFLASDAFKRGDPARLSMVQAAYKACAKPGRDAQSTSDSAAEAASPRQQADLPEFQAILNREQTPGSRNVDRGPCCAVM